MKNFDAARTDAPALHCYYCERLIVDGNWFARFRVGSDCIALCRPQCVESLFDHPDRAAGAEARSAFVNATAWQSNLNLQVHESLDRVVAGSAEACAS